MTGSVTVFPRSDIDYRVSVPSEFRDLDETTDLMQRVWESIGRFDALVGLAEADVPQDELRHYRSLQTLVSGTTDTYTVVVAYAIAYTIRTTVSWIGDERFARELLSGGTACLLQRVRESAMCCMDASLLIEQLSRYVGGVSCETVRNDSEDSQTLLNNRNPNHYFNLFRTKDGKYVLADVLAIPSMYGVRVLGDVSSVRPILDTVE